MSVIPKRLISLVQSLNIKMQLTCGRNFKKPAYNLMCQWIIDAWEDIPAELVKNSFKKCGISNKLDGSENYLMYKEEKNNTPEEPFIVLADDLEGDQKNS
ncbi:24015_t:CDS:2 [Cetraspora pellucida]|uniref:24015_t:CDS:1 n=1 Tax=Cetraspora pellucida TaxID=1433469 RepID=A0A9N9HC44_9GLOM|nr:24015_t:CDS:2 [Cetraspora pellucida]